MSTLAVEPFHVLRACAAHGLPTADRVSGVDDARPELSSDVISLALLHKVQGLLWAAIADDIVGATDHLADVARQATIRALGVCSLADRTAALALRTLADAGVDARVLKGVAIAHLDHDDSTERVYADTDMLIKRVDYDRALPALAESGFERLRPPVRGWWERRFAKAVVLRAPTGGELDLHMTVTGGYFGERIDHEALWSTSSEPFDLAGFDARGLDREGRLLHACCHAVLGGGSGLRVRRDIAQLVLVSGADWQAVVERATASGVELVVAEGVRTTWEDLSLHPDHECARWATQLAPDPVQQREIANYHDVARHGWASEGRATLSALNRFDQARFLAGLAAPSRASLRSRNRTWPQHVKDGAAVIRRRL